MMQDKRKKSQYCSPGRHQAIKATNVDNKPVFFCPILNQVLPLSQIQDVINTIYRIGEFYMKRNLVIASMLIGGFFGLLPLIAKIVIFTGLIVYLFMSYDEFSYNHDHEQRCGGMK